MKAQFSKDVNMNRESEAQRLANRADVVRKAATEMGQGAVEMAPAAIDDIEAMGQPRLIGPALSWQEAK